MAYVRGMLPTLIPEILDDSKPSIIFLNLRIITIALLLSFPSFMIRKRFLILTQLEPEDRQHLVK